MKSILGSLIGLFLFLIILFVFHRHIVNRYILDIKQTTVNSVLIKDTTKVNLNNIKVSDVSNELKTYEAILDERINSLNKRFDDLYILAAIIVTLLLAINIGVFINTDSKVEKYFKEHHQVITDKLKDYDTQAESLFSSLKARIELGSNEILKQDKKVTTPDES
jgi:hypothetical protein